MQKVKAITLNFTDKLLAILVPLGVSIVVLGFLIQIMALTMIMIGKDQVLSQWSTTLNHKFNGLFKNDPASD